MKKNSVILKWDGQPIQPSSEEEQKAFDDYDKYHTDHPEYENDIENKEEHS